MRYTRKRRGNLHEDLCMLKTRESRGAKITRGERTLSSRWGGFTDMFNTFPLQGYAGLVL